MSFDNALIAAGFIIDKPLIAGSHQVQRFAMRDSKSKKNGWALLFEDGDSGVYGDWRQGGFYEYWREDGQRFEQLSEEKKQKAKEQRKIAEKIQQDEQLELAEKNLIEWESLPHVGGEEYLKKKQVGSYGLKGAFCPARDFDGKLWNFQNIATNPKLFNRGKVKGCFHRIEGNKEKTIITSGYATGASIYEATGLEVIVCFGDNNVFEVAKTFKDKGIKDIYCAVDNDSGGSESGNKIGSKIKDILGLPVVIPNKAGDFNDLAVAGDNISSYFIESIDVFTIGELLNDNSPMPKDIISPRVLTNGGMLVFGGAPKVGKSDFMLSWLMHMAGGSKFMDMKPREPLKIFYLQAEVQYDYLRERVKAVDIDRDVLSKASKNMVVTPQLRMILNDDGVKMVGNTINQCFATQKPDIIAIDPISNLYDGKSENDNAEMMAFLSQRVEGLRKYAKPDTAFVLIHHTKKISKEELVKDPFQMFSGASSLRRYYTTGMVMYRPDEEVSETVITYEVRNGARIPNINVDKIEGRWCKISKEQSRIAHQGQGKRNDNERQRKIDVIKSIVNGEAVDKKYYTKTEFANAFAGQFDLGGASTIKALLSEMLAQDELCFFSLENSLKKYLKT